MATIKIMTDSASDIPAQYEADYDIEILNFPLTIGDETYFERVDFPEHEDFYKILYSAPKIPTHAQLTPMVFEEKFEEFLEKGYQDLIYVCINAKGSNTYNSARMARQQFEQKHPDAVMRIHILDSKTYSYAYGYAAVEAAKKAQKGVPVNEILAYLADWFNTLEIYATAYALDFAKKSGRVSSTAAFVGELLGLKPVITFIDGDNATPAKVRGDKAVVPALVRMAKEHIVPKTPYLVLYGNNLEERDKLIRELEKALGYPAADVIQIGATISINIGANLVGVVVKGAPKHELGPIS